MRILKISTIFLLTIYLLTCNIYASEIFQTGKEWLDLADSESTSPGLSFATSYSELEKLAGVLFGIGVFVIVGAGMIIGAKYMLASAEKRAQLKQTLIIYVVGSVLILGSLGIWRIVVNVLESTT